MVKKIKNITGQVSDLYMLENPHFFYQLVVYFPDAGRGEQPNSIINLSDIFVDQIDLKLVEEQAEETVTETSACFFFKS